jgi:hypothetical protein
VVNTSLTGLRVARELDRIAEQLSLQDRQRQWDRVEQHEPPSDSSRLRPAHLCLLRSSHLPRARNIMERLPKSLHASVRRVLRQAWERDDADKAEKLLRNLAQRLERDWFGSPARSWKASTRSSPSRGLDCRRS